MAPALNREQLNLINDVYYKQKFVFGRDKLYQYLRTNHIDANISRRQVAEWLAAQEMNQLHKDPKVKKPKTVKSTVLKEPHNTLAVDLIDVQNIAVDGYKFIFNGIDMFSRKLYSVPIHKKSESPNALKKILPQIPNLKHVRSDNGGEFKSARFKKVLTDNKVKQIFSESYTPQSNGMIERANRVLKRAINKLINYDDKFNWVKSLDIVVSNINKTVSRGTNKSPDMVEEEFKKKNNKFIEDVYAYQIKQKSNTLAKPMFIPLFDKVRIYQPSDKFKSLKWSKEVYTVEKVIKPTKPYGAYEYKLKGLTKRYKEEQLQKIPEVQNKSSKPEIFEISNLIKPVVLKNKAHYEVSWKNYKDLTTEPRDSLVKDMPKHVESFERKYDVKWYKTKGRVRFSHNKEPFPKTTKTLKKPPKETPAEPVVEEEPVDEEPDIEEPTEEPVDEEEAYNFDTIIRPVVRNKQPYYTVRWEGGEETNEPRPQLIEDVPEEVERFDEEHSVVWKKPKKGKPWTYTWKP